MSKVKTTLNFNPEIWEKFKKVCEDKHTRSATDQLIHMMKQEVSAYEAEKTAQRNFENSSEQSGVHVRMNTDQGKRSATG